MEKYTDQEFFYKQTPVNYDGIAKFTSIKGNTLVWNQLAEITKATATINGVTFTNSNNQSISASGTASANCYFYLKGSSAQRINVGKGKILLKGCPNGGGTSTFRITLRTYINGSPVWYSDTGNGVIFDCDEYIDNVSVFIGNGTTVSNLNFVPQVFNLTQMGLDTITSVDEFTSLFPLPFYDFNQGTLIPFSGNGIKTTGKNLLQNNASSKTENGVTFTVNEDGTVIANGTATGGNSNLSIASGLYLRKGNYFISGCPSGGSSSTYSWMIVTKYNGQWIQDFGNGKAFTMAEDGYCDVYFARVINGATANNLTFKPMITFQGVDDSFEPYQEQTTSLPISNYFPTGMKSAGNVYDELTESKAITRIGRVDLGTLTYTRVTNKRYQTTGLADLCKWGAQGTRQLNLLCSKFIADTSTNAGTVYGGDISSKTIYFWTNEDEYQSADAFKSAMSGVYLYYELATETETDAEDIFYKFYADGTEQILPVNGSAPTTSYIIADIEYYDSTEGDSLYRRFWLINGDGERWDLTDKEFKSFLNNPTGLGFRKTIEITRYGEKANKNNEVYDFPQPSGELLFYDTYNSTRYDKYNKFIRFLMSQPITLYYMIPVSYISGIANIFTLDCDVTEVQKTESKTDRILTSSIVFNGLGFYEGDEISVNGTTNTYTLTNEGDFPIGFEITVEGSLTNPYITLSQDGELYGEAKFDSATAFNSLYLNSNDGEQNIILQQGGSVIPNPLSYQDLSISNGSIYVTFVKLAKGVSELSIGVESGSISNVNIKYSPKYRSV